MRGSDRLTIGSVEHVVPATDTTEGYLVVRRDGRVFDKLLELVQFARVRKSGFRRRIYVPLDAIVKRVGRNIIVNVPRIAVRKMPWNQPPVHATQEAKYGPKIYEVEKLYRSLSPTIHTVSPDTTGRPAAGETYLPKSERVHAFPRGHTALLVIDPVNDFLSEGGAAWDLTKSTVRRHNVVGHLKLLIDGARKCGIPILFGPMAYTEDDYQTRHLQRRSGINRLQFERKMFLAGSWGADFHPDLRPGESDVVLLPHKGIDVFMTDLPAHLERLQITHLVIAGMTANLCVESTGRHAMEAGYDVTFISNAIGADSHPSWLVAVHLNFPMVGNAVLTVKDFLAAVDALHAAG